MSRYATSLIQSAVAQERAQTFTFCHFTNAHTELKSRSFHRECIPLAASGIDVRHVAPAGIQGVRDGVSLIDLPDGKSRLRRLASFPSILGELIRQDANLYHFQDPELLPLAVVLRLLFGKRVVYDAYEDFPSMVANKTSIPRCLQPAAAKIVAAAEFLAACCLDGLMTADPLTLRRFARAGMSRKLVFYNFPNLDYFPPPRDSAKTFDVVYRGGLSKRAGTFVLLDALRLLANRGRRVRLLLIGYFDHSAAEKTLRGRIRALGLEPCVEICGRIPHEEMAKMLSQARIGVSPLQAVPKFLRNIPVKVFEYWACGLPVVASDLPPIRPFLLGTRAGLLFRADNVAELAQSIGWLLDHADAATRMGKRGREAIVSRLNNQNELRKLRRFCMQLGSVM
jgi:glycosyltransferase involved in cell wall biosynthesis